MGVFTSAKAKLAAQKLAEEQLYEFAADNNWVRHKGASTAHKAAYLGVFVIPAALMLL